MAMSNNQMVVLSATIGADSTRGVNAEARERARTEAGARVLPKPRGEPPEPEMVASFCVDHLAG